MRQNPPWNIWLTCGGHRYVQDQTTEPNPILSEIQTLTTKHQILHSTSSHYFLVLLPPASAPAPEADCAAFLAAFSWSALASLSKRSNSTHKRNINKTKAELWSDDNLSRRCSGVKPSSLPLLPLEGFRAWALSRSRSLWFPRYIKLGKNTLTWWSPRKSKIKITETGKKKNKIYHESKTQ